MTRNIKVDMMKRVQQFAFNIVICLTLAVEKNQHTQFFNICIKIAIYGVIYNEIKIGIKSCY